jgi:tetratricopeptide (TPR) repeat protein
MKFGVESLVSRNYEASLRVSFDAINCEPLNPRGYFLRGLVKYDIELYLDAIGDFNLALALDSGISDIYYQRGLCWKAIEEYSAAILDFQRALKLDPYSPNVYHSISLSYMGLGNLEAARTNIDRAVKLSPNDYLLTRARILQHQNQQIYALAEYSKLIQINPVDEIAYIGRGECNEKLHYYREAINDYKQSIEVNPMQWQGYFRLGCLYENSLNDTTRALKSYINLMKYCVPNETFYSDAFLVLNESELFGLVYRDYEEYKELCKVAIQRKRSKEYYLNVLYEEGYFDQCDECRLFAELMFDDLSQSMDGYWVD